jgi:hypothetical protein
MARRAGKMLTYEPVSIVSVEPSVSHPLDAGNAELAWLATPGEVLATNPSNLIFLSDGAALHITTANSATDLTRQPIEVQPASDYLLNLPIESFAGRVVITIVGTDTGKTLASATVPDSLPGGSAREGDQATLQVPFVNVTAERLKIVVANAGSNPPGAIEVGTIELRRLGPSAFLWTKFPRMLVKRLQKFFTTRWMLPLALAGAVLLALARRLDALAVICAVPLYYVCTHAPIHLELRYILPVHYFWGMLVASSLYFVLMSGWRLFRRVKRSRLPG